MEFLVILSWNVLFNDLEGIVMEVWILWSVSEFLLLVAELYHLLLDKLALDHKLVDFTHKEEHAACSKSCTAFLKALLTCSADLVVAGSSQQAASVCLSVCPERRLLALHNVMFQATSESGKLLDFTLFCHKKIGLICKKWKMNICTNNITHTRSQKGWC